MTIRQTGLRSLPAGHPFRKPEGKTPQELAAEIVGFHRGRWADLNMGPDPDPDDDPDDDDPPENTPGDTKVVIDGKEHTVAQLQRIMAREKREGTRKGMKDLLEKLGFEKPEDAEVFVNQAREKVKEQETEIERKDREAEERVKAAEKRERDAAAKERRTELRGALRDAGVARDDLDDAFALLDREVPDEYDEDALEEAVEKLEERRAELFGNDAAPPTPRQRGALPEGGRRKPPRPTGKKFGEAGLARAERRFGKQDSKA